mmetsp:Transcript_43806/g.70120  ORF Transcript_43806/g.70120 Transcript_43806/m.70120 type:complete len:94 (+) Transcript_43806:628-909(+)
MSISLHIFIATLRYLIRARLLKVRDNGKMEIGLATEGRLDRRHDENVSTGWCSKECLSKSCLPECRTLEASHTKIEYAKVNANMDMSKTKHRN